jgi:hypothetical protein
MKIGVDCDDTIANFVGPFISWHNEKYGTSAKEEEVNVFDMAPILGISNEVCRERIEEFYRGSGLENMPLIDGAKEALLQLKEEGNELYNVTARPKPLEERTRNYFNINLPNIFTDIYFSNNLISSTNNINKGEVCKKLGLSFFIEDGLKYAEQCAKEGIITILFNKPWNKCSSEFEIQNRFIRVFSWQDVPNTIKRYSSFKRK